MPYTKSGLWIPRDKSIPRKERRPHAWTIWLSLLYTAAITTAGIVVAIISVQNNTNHLMLANQAYIAFDTFKFAFPDDAPLELDVVFENTGVTQH